MKRYVYENVEVLRIIDGDTIEVMIDLGFDIWKKIKIRLKGINTPEVKGDTKTLGEASSAYLESLIPVNSFIKIECFKQDKYGRWLANIYKEDLFINEHLVEKGYAEKYFE